MTDVRHIRQPPPNFREFVAEVAEGLDQLYGPAAGDEYRAVAEERMGGNVAHPRVRAWASFAGERAAALLVCVLREPTAQFSFLHVLRGESGRGHEQALVRNAVEHFRGSGLGGILAECVCFSPIEVDATFKALGFTAVGRHLMSADLTKAGWIEGEALESVPYRKEHWDEVAEVIVDAYREHPGRDLHLEVRDPGHAREFVEMAALQGYGEAGAEFGRMIRRKGRIAGAIVGCRVAPGVGFVLQVVVRRAFQNQGIGARLVRELGAVYRDAGFARIGLGVTNANPAKRLYRRLGFKPIRPVTAYVWWRAP